MTATEKRPYRLGRRAEKQAETRQRIVEAAVDLHSTLGPARTSLSAIAERAGVQRHTVYAHFPDDGALFSACTAHWAVRNPFPDPAAWAGVEDPIERVRAALGPIYAWYAVHEDELSLFARDAAVYPPFFEAQRARQEALADALARGLPHRRAVRAAVGHALEFETWRSLARTQRLGDQGAADLAVRLVQSA